MHTAVFLVTVVPFIGALATTAFVFLRRARKTAGPDRVHELLAMLAAVDRDKLAQVAASETLDSHHSESALEPWQVWELAGGVEGLEALARNCDVLIELACHVQQWFPEAVVVAEQLRLNARELQWHVQRLKAAELHGHTQSAYPEYAQRAVAIYQSMTHHVIALYEAAGMAELATMQAAL